MTINRDDFEYWLSNMDDELTELVNNLPSDIQMKLDYSKESLLSLENWILNSYSTVNEIMKNDQKLMIDRLSRYVGETLRKIVGGIWNINLENKKDVYYQIPIIEWIQKKITVKECPVSLITAAVDRRTGDYIYKVVENLSVARH